ncbi:hypothetical protein [Pedobacter namyangjuensis]|uniref:hypothetical protein n=1 Tax=Pedobacter namyangjuensis TaxID=600626 RepID=UPI000DE54F10|nr:hypothetical protein [Pedobacter namyangjuensis]
MNKTIVGDYYARNFGKWYLKIDSNNSFQFISEDYNALYAKKELFFQTKGVWFRRGDSLLLNSKPSKSGMLRNNVEILEKIAEESTFMFFDSFGDTIQFNNVLKNQVLFAARFHGDYSKINAKVVKGDFFEFDFINTYQPFTFKIPTNESKIYKVTLARKEKSDYFKDYIFLIKNKKLIDLVQKREYRKSK